MKITLVEWMQLHIKFNDLNRAMAAVEQQLSMLFMELCKRGDATGMALLNSMALDVNAAMAFIHKHDTLPQSEWMGGLTEGVGSEKTKTYLREPHCAGLGSSRRYFSAEEVAEAKKQGLLAGGDDLTGPESS